MRRLQVRRGVVRVDRRGRRGSLEGLRGPRLSEVARRHDHRPDVGPRRVIEDAQRQGHVAAPHGQPQRGACAPCHCYRADDEPERATAQIAREPRYCQREAYRGQILRPLGDDDARSEEHTSELQSLAYLVCRLLLEKKKKKKNKRYHHVTEIKKNDDMKL